MKFKEWPPGVGLMLKVDDAGLVIEGCYSNGVDSALLYAENLTEKFFDLSSGEAGGGFCRSCGITGSASRLCTIPRVYDSAAGLARWRPKRGASDIFGCSNRIRRLGNG
jgi:hypothetical protein